MSRARRTTKPYTLWVQGLHKEYIMGTFATVETATERALNWHANGHHAVITEERVVRAFQGPGYGVVKMPHE